MVYSMPKNFISLAEGMPNEKTFPFTEITIKLYDGTSFTLNGKELAHALQYMPTQGFPPLLQVEESILSLIIRHRVLRATFRGGGKSTCREKRRETAKYTGRTG